MNKILLVEDEEAIRKFTKINLEQAGFETIEAETGEKGVELALSERPEVVVLDIMLPGIDGYEVCNILRKEMPEIGIIMLTAKTQEVDKILGLESGTDDYMIKPFNPQELILRIKSLLRRMGSDKDENVIKDGPFVLDTYSRTFTKNGEKIDLTPTELSIIKIFMTNSGRAFSRDEIMDLSWGKDFDGDSKIVDVNIRRIRTKIEDDSSNPEYIKTVWGVGYRWRD